MPHLWLCTLTSMGVHALPCSILGSRGRLIFSVRLMGKFARKSSTTAAQGKRVEGALAGIKILDLSRVLAVR